MLVIVQQILNDFYIVWVIVIWYVGSVLGSCATISLLRRGHRNTAKIILVKDFRWPFHFKF